MTSELVLSCPFEKWPEPNAKPGQEQRPCPSDWDVYIVRRDGSIRVPGRDLFLSSVLVSEP